MPRTVEQTVYKFDELSDEAKESSMSDKVIGDNDILDCGHPPTSPRSPVTTG